MTNLFRTSGTGLSTWALFWLGLLTLGLIFLAKKSTSNMVSLIKNKLTASGYSDQVATWWVAVSNFETATIQNGKAVPWTSDLCVKYNNMFGMKQPKIRPTLSLGPVGRGFASFAARGDSVDDLILYMESWKYPKDFLSFDDFVAFMKKVGYFEEDYRYYYDGVKSRL